MSNDIGLIWKDGQADITLNTDSTDLQVGHDLQTAILVSLFTDARAPITDVPSSEADLRGWWSANLGSLLWLLSRAKATPANLEKGMDYIRRALNWLLIKEIADKIDVSGAILNLETFTFDIKITRSLSAKYQYLWDGIENVLYEFDRSSFTVQYL